ncbi:nucleotidyltransferase domain-containing protein [Leptolyngbya sp. FACHB-321]|uniref:nucleotidyltransferase family protein n=1 Tax=Leptolyngbya sp. FACHB-321 TaxID=2692807 RepID=UPI00168383A0|nr:nucleotidyltransferase domain-containing protein [Leptolyngbya sp. FACHB-321]MBD2037956.1 nucleotidyltransferase domain-containing protein [Leptolyngbya sp. FACHB-321]
MKRDEVLSQVAVHQEELKQLGVKSLDLFGSVARDKARPESDVDFLVEFAIDAGFFDLFQVQHYLEAILGSGVDLGTQAVLREDLCEPVLRDLIHAF